MSSNSPAFAMVRQLLPILVDTVKVPVRNICIHSSPDCYFCHLEIVSRLEWKPRRMLLSFIGERFSSGSDATDAVKDDREGDEDPKLTCLGRLYVLNYSLWVKGNTQIFDTERSRKYNEKNRFETDDTKVQGQFHDIAKIVPAKYWASSRTKSHLARLLKWLRWSEVRLSGLIRLQKMGSNLGTNTFNN
ncbi:hypothetical protein C8J57DRAFT_1231459 [Mycena rebaudengoi]|nr:hypothetical protein C8J57DRAFT_1231459 [Mycena rebaudengoi]